MSSRSNPKDKYRHQEDKWDDILKEAGLYDPELPSEEKENLVAVLSESKRQSANDSLRSLWSENDEKEQMEQVFAEESSPPKEELLENEVEHANDNVPESEDEKDMFADEDCCDDKMFFTTSNEVRNIEDRELALPENDDDSSQSSNKSVSEKDHASAAKNVQARSIAEFTAVMDADLGWNPVEHNNDEPIPLYETRLENIRESKKGPEKLNLFYDGTLSKTEQYKYTAFTLHKNSILMAKMLMMNLKYNSSDPKWSPAILPCTDKNIKSMDRYPCREPKECLRLPWGDKPVILAWKSNANSFALKSHSSYPPLSLSKSTTLNKESSAPSSSHQTSNFSEASDENVRPAKRRASKKQIASALEMSSDNDDDSDSDWLAPKPVNPKNQAGKGSRGKRGARGGATVRGRSNKKRGGGSGEEFRPYPPVVGVQQPLLQTRKGLTNADITITHPSLDEDMQAECPICNGSFPKSDIEDHASNCDSFPDSQSSPTTTCPRCNTVVPESVAEQHYSKCGAKRSKQSEIPSTSVATQGAGDATNENDDVISGDEDIFNPPPVKRKRNIIEKES